VTWLNNAFQLMYMPIGIFGVSVATAAIPDIARFAADNSFAEMRKTLSYGMRLMLALSVPACVGLMVLGGPISELTLEGGRFTSFDSRMVAAALMFYAPGLVGYSLVKLLSPSFYALRDPRTPVIVSVIAVATNLVLNLLFVRSYGFRGLALGTGIAANVNAGLLLYLLSRRVEGGIDGRRVFVTFVKVLIASVAMGAAAYFSERAIHALLPAGTLLFRAIRVGGGIGTGLVVLAVVAHLMHIEEFRQASDRILKRVRG
jgi:putative peptidoglycan lipid II flippase